jgi:hypothetical protein
MNRIIIVVESRNGLMHISLLKISDISRIFGVIFYT